MSWSQLPYLFKIPVVMIKSAHILHCIITLEYSYIMVRYLDLVGKVVPLKPGTTFLCITTGKLANK